MNGDWHLELNSAPGRERLGPVLDEGVANERSDLLVARQDGGDHAGGVGIRTGAVTRHDDR